MNDKIKDSSKRAKRKWEEINTYKTTITFYKKKFPKEEFEKAKEEIRKMGKSLNQFLTEKLKELCE